MTTAKPGDTVRLHYTGRLTDGTVFDSSEGKDPLEFQAGQNMLVPGLDREIVGMTVGEKKTVEVSFSEGYGARDDSKVQMVPKSQLPEGLPIQIGQHLQLTAPNGEVVMVHVSDITDDEVALDANHFLAGKDLQFDVELVSVETE